MEPNSARRTYRQVLDDPAINQDHVIVEDTKVPDYLGKGYTLVEDLVGEMSLLRRPKGATQ